jgi:hypothetical protein
MLGGGDAALADYEAWLKKDGARVKGLWASYISTKNYVRTVIVDNVAQDRTVPILHPHGRVRAVREPTHPRSIRERIVAFAQSAYLAGMGQALFPRRRKQGGLSVDEANCSR